MYYLRSEEFFHKLCAVVCFVYVCVYPHQMLGASLWKNAQLLPSFLLCPLLALSPSRCANEQLSSSDRERAERCSLLLSLAPRCVLGRGGRPWPRVPAPALRSAGPAPAWPPSRRSEENELHPALPLLSGTS